MKMLLAHRSGMRRDFSEDTLDLVKDIEKSFYRVWAARRVLSQPLSQPNGDYGYSNAGYGVVAAAMEMVSGGRSWEALMQEKIFNPLGMDSCGFGQPVPNDRSLDQPWGHRKTIGTALGKTLETTLGTTKPILPSVFDQFWHPLWYPGGGVYCNLADWGKYLQFHLDGYRGDTPYLSKESFSILHTPFAEDGQSLYTPGGWVFSNVNLAGGPSLSHSGNVLTYRSKVFLGLETGVGTMIVINSDYPENQRDFDKAFSALIGLTSFAGSLNDTLQIEVPDENFGNILDNLNGLLDLGDEVPTLLPPDNDSSAVQNLRDEFAPGVMYSTPGFNDPVLMNYENQRVCRVVRDYTDVQTQSADNYIRLKQLGSEIGLILDCP